MIRIFLFILLIVASSAWAESLDRIIAVVNNEVILESELIEMAHTVSREARQRGAAIPPADILRKQVLERLVMQKLQLQRAAQIGVRIGDDALNAALRQIASNNNLSLREFRDVLEEDGFDFVDFRESIREEMILSRLRKSQIEDRILVSDREIDSFLATQVAQGGNQEEAYHLFHILISVPATALPDQIQAAQQKLTTVQTLLAQGVEFSEVALAYSDGSNALDGGDLGWRKKGELPSLFADILPTLAIADVSDVIRSDSGFNLVKLADKKSEETYMVKQTLASHILIKLDELTTDKDAEDGLNELRERIFNGEDFAELARAHSDDTGSAINGGSLGWFSSGAMVPEFEQKADALSDGEVSEVFKSRFGWHMIKVYERREENMAQEFKRNKARQQMHKRKSAEFFESWLRQLRDEAYVEYRDL